MYDAEYSTPWGDARFAFYSGQYTPTTAFDGTDVMVGAVEEVDQQYAIYRLNHFLPTRAITTDVTITKDDINAMLGVEKLKDLLGCDTTVCITELGGAAGADLVLHGNVGQMGASYALNLSIVGVTDGSVIGRVSHLAPTSDDSLVRAVPTVVESLVDKINKN